MVGEKAAGHREQHERQREQRARQGHQASCFATETNHAHADKSHQRLEGVVVERAFELGDDQAPKPTHGRPAGFCRFRVRLSLFHI